MGRRLPQICAEIHGSKPDRRRRPFPNPRLHPSAHLYRRTTTLVFSKQNVVEKVSERSLCSSFCRGIVACPRSQGCQMSNVKRRMSNGVVKLPTDPLTQLVS